MVCEDGLDNLRSTILSDTAVANPENLSKPHNEIPDYAEEARKANAEARRTESIMAERGGLLGYDNPLPDGREKWQAKQGINKLDLNGRDTRVLWALIDYANRDTGLCYPSQKTISGLLTLPIRAVERSIRSLTRKKLIKPQPTIGQNGMFNRYRINWKPLFAAYETMEGFKASKKTKTDG